MRINWRKGWLFIILVGLCLLYWMRPSSEDALFISRYETAIQEQLIAVLDPKQERIQSVTLLPKTAKGYYDNGGDVGGIYHISVRAYANGNKRYGMTAILTFPEVGIGPFTFIKPNPYEKQADMSEWVVEVDTDESKPWKWKIEQEQAAAKAEKEAVLAEEAEKTALSNQLRPHLKTWMEQHQPGLTSAIQSFLYTHYPDLEPVLGQLESVSFYEGWRYYKNGDPVLFQLQFTHFPDAKVQFRAGLLVEDISFGDMNKGAELVLGHSGVYSFTLETEYNSPVAKAIKKAVGREVIIRDVETIAIP